VISNRCCLYEAAELLAKHFATHRTLHAAAESHEGTEFGGRPDFRGAITALGEILGVFVAEDILGDTGIFQSGVAVNFARSGFVYGLFHRHRHIHRLSGHEDGDHLLAGINNGRGIHSFFATHFGANHRIFEALGDVLRLSAPALHRHLNSAFKRFGREKYGSKEETGE